MGHKCDNVNIISRTHVEVEGGNPPPKLPSDIYMYTKEPVLPYLKSHMIFTNDNDKVIYWKLSKRDSILTVNSKYSWKHWHKSYHQSDGEYCRCNLLFQDYTYMLLVKLNHFMVFSVENVYQYWLILTESSTLLFILFCFYFVFWYFF